MHDNKEHSILVVDDESTNISELTHILSGKYVVYAAKNGSGAIKAAEKHSPDIILLDIIMPEMDGYSVLSLLKSSEKTKEIPIIIISNLDSEEDEEKGLLLGASDYIIKPFKPGIIELRVKNQVQIRDQIRIIEQLSMTDQLTDLPNRRNFDNRLDLEWFRSIREKTPISILLLDVDKFKGYNDTYGHKQGDVALQALAKTLTGELKRCGDFAARWGGEEFIVLLANTDSKGAYYVAERIRKRVGNMKIPCADGLNTKITVSIGINAVMPSQSCSYDDFISNADKALYMAKETGRNKICVYSSAVNTAQSEDA